MNIALLLVDPAPEEHDSSLQIASFAAAALVAGDAPGKWKRVALLASPADALEILLAVGDVVGRSGPEERHSPLVLLQPLPAPEGDTAQQNLLPSRPGSLDDFAGSGTLDDLARTGAFTFEHPETPDALPAATLRQELARPGQRTNLVLGGRREFWAEMRGQTRIIAFGQEARRRRDLVTNLVLIEELAETGPAEPLGESFDEGDGTDALYGARLGRQIATVLELLDGPAPA
jgi:hypothetical protein